MRIELESRGKEAKSLKDQLVSVQEKFQTRHGVRKQYLKKTQALTEESGHVEAETWKLLNSVCINEDVHTMNSMNSQQQTNTWIGENNKIVAHFPNAEVFAEVESLRKLQHVIASIVARNSSRLTSMMSSRCDGEMDRTRRVDGLMKSESVMLEKELEKVREVSKYVAESAATRQDYDTQIEDDFRVLTELALAVRSLEEEVHDGRKSRKGRPSEKLDNHGCSSRITELQSHVNMLKQQVSEAQNAYTEDSKQLQADLNNMKVQKRNLKTKFQADIKSIFADLEFIAGRIDRTEASLEKANIHYQLDEEEIVNVVSPIIEGIDVLREKIEAISRDAEEIFYGN